MNYGFQNTDLIVYGVPVLLVWCVFWVLNQRGVFKRLKQPTVRLASLSSVEAAPRSLWLLLRPLVLALRIFVVFLLLFALARPQTSRAIHSVKTHGIDIVLVIDTSGSMEALDLDVTQAVRNRKNRLEVVKDVVAEFVDERENDQIGLVIFGEFAFTQCPLTLDHDVVNILLDRAQIGVAGQATAVGSALGVAVKRIQKSTAESKVIILLTDGRNNAGALAPLTAAEIAATKGVKVYTIGAGTSGKAPILRPGLFGPQVQYIEADLDEDTLRQIAEITGGEYFRAEDEAALGAIYEQIDALERTEIEELATMEYEEKFHWFLFPALLLLLLEVVALNTRFRRLP